MVLLSLLLPLLASPDTSPVLLAQCDALGLSNDVDLLFTDGKALPKGLRDLQPKVASFLAAEGTAGDALLASSATDLRAKDGCDESTLRTGLADLDEKTLDGGFRLKDIVELVGPSRAGKTFVSRGLFSLLSCHADAGPRSRTRCSSPSTPS